MINEELALVTLSSLHHNNTITKLKINSNLQRSDAIIKDIHDINTARRNLNIQKLNVSYGTLY